MSLQDLEQLNKLRVGIVGCGHLGQAIALSLIKHGLEKENLLISHKGSPDTYRKLEKAGLSSCLAGNKKLFDEAGIILVTVKPQDLTGLYENNIHDGKLVVSCVAGVPLKLLRKLFKTDIMRMMFSGPDTILSDKGVAAVYPHNEHLAHIIRFLNLKYVQMGAESDLNIFTAGVCLPAAILKISNTEEELVAIAGIAKEYPLLPELFEWAVKVLPEFNSRREKDDYISRMITKGGITDAIIKSLEAGDPLDVALRRGIARTREISSEIEKSIMARIDELEKGD